MKKAILLTFICLAGILIFSNFKESTANFVFTTMNDSPVLPNEPFTYDDVIIPDHLLTPEEDTITTGYGSSGVDPNTLDFLENDKATLGRVLFYDEKLSALENISCASCHDQSLSFTENKSFSEGVSSLTKRNSMHLNDIGWTNREGFFWDMKGTDLHEMIALPLKDENEIGANMADVRLKLSDTYYYPQLFELAYGDQSITEDRIVESLVHFISSMTTFNSKFDQNSANGFADFSESEMKGADIFAVNCGVCHTQGDILSAIFVVDENEEEEFFLNMTPFEVIPFFFNNGLPADEDDKGVGEWNENGFDNLFKLPSLRNIELTAPYMHDGRFSNLDEVIDHYSEDVVENDWSVGLIPEGGFKFSQTEKEDLKAFLLTLTDETFLKNERWSNPFQTTNSTEELEISDVIVKPNPMDERSIIEFSNPQDKLISMNIYNETGQLIQHKNTRDNFITIEKRDFNSGVYFVELIQDNKRATRKLIVR